MKLYFHKITTFLFQILLTQIMNVVNIIRARNPALRTNSKYIYPITTQWSYCSNSKNDDKKNEENVDNKKEENVDINLKKGKGKRIFSKPTSSLKMSREKLAVEGIHDLLENMKHGHVDKEPVVEKHDEKVEEINVDPAQKLHDLLKLAVAVPIKEEVKMTKPKKVTKPKQSGGLLEKVKAAAVDLGGDVETIQKELLEAYKSATSQSPTYKPKTMGSSRDKEDYRKKQKVVSYTDDMRRNTLISDDKLGIFTKQAKEQEPQLKLWNQLNSMTLTNMSIAPPKNYFEQLILWTHQGKLWHFPIDNEQGLDVEKSIDFTEHVFLEKHLEPWCPKSGPLRHFMELVTVGLSKNPYITVEQKKEHIFWYRDYFENKRKLLTEIGAYDNPTDEEIKSE